MSDDEQAAHVHTLYHQAGLLTLPEPLEGKGDDSEQGEQARQDPLEAQAFSLRARDLAWVRGQCEGPPLRKILHHYQIASLEDLTDIQLLDVVASIRRHQHPAS